MAPRGSDSIYNRVRRILESARASVARSVNTTQIMAYWLIGREIVEEQQRGKRRAGYGEQLLAELSSKLTAEFGKGVSVSNLDLEHCRNFYSEYPHLLDGKISNAVRSIFPEASTTEISYAVRSKSDSETGGIRHARHVNPKRRVGNLL